jgi:hypothetical protein
MVNRAAAIMDTLVGILVDLQLPVVLLAIRPAGCQLALRRYGLLALMDEALADVDERGDAQWIQCAFVERRRELLPLDHEGPELRRPESAVFVKRTVTIAGSTRRRIGPARVSGRGIICSQVFKLGDVSRLCAVLARHKDFKPTIPVGPDCQMVCFSNPGRWTPETLPLAPEG